MFRKNYSIRYLTGITSNILKIRYNLPVNIFYK